MGKHVRRGSILGWLLAQKLPSLMFWALGINDIHHVVPLQPWGRLVAL
jgi:hypothetical protein